MKRSELETSSYLKNDCLSIHCTVEVVHDRFETAQTNIQEGKHDIIPVPPSDMIQNLKDLLESEIGSDVTFQVGNEFFRAHKSILAARSPAMLYLYSDELPEPRELSDSDSLCTSITIMQHLLDAVDRFDLDRLRLMCEAKLCEEITTNTVATTLALEEQHQCLQLKTACLKFAAKPENLEEIMKSDGFAYLEKSCPSLLVDLLKTSALIDKNHVAAYENDQSVMS
ncbi:BTB/POZ and MATH domain-containing protein 3-like [Papaver somniferum]|uniref:BTB/POZ and MATH domain-containing protein 3-like n=1 Tax=Papaver somniferum TaxID=3469 RepID=UPI000E6FC644|nr:BTB/POZ and MATH domain-containing protein 3-like [Papaver somniferum]XP_026416414.1 BTB/POZ and MATH domain-containing protein 3-like [Papaver somniferum]